MLTLVFVKHRTFHCKASCYLRQIYVDLSGRASSLGIKASLAYILTKLQGYYGFHEYIYPLIWSVCGTLSCNEIVLSAEVLFKK